MSAAALMILLADLHCAALRQGLPASAVMAVGDGGNDLAMLSGVTAAGGLGVAMANAVPAVRLVFRPGAGIAARQEREVIVFEDACKILFPNC